MAASFRSPVAWSLVFVALCVVHVHSARADIADPSKGKSAFKGVSFTSRFDTTVASPPVVEHTACAHPTKEDIFYVAGGKNSLGKLSSDIFVYQRGAVNEVGAVVAGPGAQRTGHCAFFFGLNLVLWGGRRGTRTQMPFAFDIDIGLETRVVSEGTDPNLEYMSCACVTSSCTQVLVYGGVDTSGASNRDTYRLTLSTVNNFDIKITVEKLTTSGSPGSARSHHTANILGANKMYVLGGQTEDGLKLYDFKVLDLDTLVWSDVMVTSSVKQIPERSDHATVKLSEDSLLVFGGHQQASVFNDVSIFNSVTHEWTRYTPAGTAVKVYAHAAVLLNSEVFVLGGKKEDGTEADALQPLLIDFDTCPNGCGNYGTCQDDIECICEAGRSGKGCETYLMNWHSIDSGNVGSTSSDIDAAGTTTPGYRFGSVMFASDEDNRLYLFAGYGSNGKSHPKADMWVMDRPSPSSSSSWRTLTPSSGPRPLARYGACTWTVGSTAYMFAGHDGQSALNDLYSFDMKTNTWSVLNAGGSLPTPRVYHACSVISPTKVWVFGGTPDEVTDLDDSYTLDLSQPSSPIWTREITTVGYSAAAKPHTTFQLGRYGTVGTYIPKRNRILYTSGLYQDLKIHDLLQLDLASKQFDTVKYPATIKISKRYLHTAYLHEHGEGVIIFGGQCNGPIHNDVYVYDYDHIVYNKPVLSGKPPLPRVGQASAVLGSKMYLYGGLSEGDLHLDDTFVLETVGCPANHIEEGSLQMEACSGHGTCNQGRCQCNDGYDGIDCVNFVGTSADQSTIVIIGTSASGVVVVVVLVALLLWRRRMLDGIVALGPPTGVITFASTDVESSTSLWEAHPDCMNQAMAIHNKLLRSLLHKHHGYEVSTEGDAFLVAFHDAKSCVQWALDVQEELLVQHWPAKLLRESNTAPMWPKGTPAKEQRTDNLLFNGLRVRIGIHTCEPAVEKHPVTGRTLYEGEGVDLVNLVCDSAQGGQVVFTDATAANWGGLEGVHILDMGSYQYEAQNEPTNVIEVFRDRFKARSDTYFVGKLRNVRKIRPGYYEAPTGDVTLIMLYPEGRKRLQKANPKSYKSAMGVYGPTLRSLLLTHHGYEIQEVQDSFVLAFGSATNAALFAVDFLGTLSSIQWSKDMQDMIAKVGRARNMYLGIRPKLALYTDTPTGHGAHSGTGRMEYWGPFLNRCSRMAYIGSGGQILMPDSTVNALVAEGGLKAVEGSVVDLGIRNLRGVGPVHFNQLLPKRFESWDFDDIDASRSETSVGTTTTLGTVNSNSTKQIEALIRSNSSVANKYWSETAPNSGAVSAVGTTGPDTSSVNLEEQVSDHETDLMLDAMALPNMATP
eukprot:TRINITY_DN132_c0_g1_i4.p1 TRINITY_DN132_c0_g1~~TRINITY_DN132_c0_g1_i4.p1  ORF type:complete len:1373 (-),score=277.55 TRINITY_DN132_c0_g1_i4:119-4150(-)